MNLSPNVLLGFQRLQLQQILCGRCRSTTELSHWLCETLHRQAHYFQWGVRLRSPEQLCELYRLVWSCAGKLQPIWTVTLQHVSSSIRALTEGRRNKITACLFLYFEWCNTMNHLLYNRCIMFPTVQSWTGFGERGADCICANGRTPSWAHGTISAHCHIRGAKLPCSAWKMHGLYPWAHLHFRASSYLASHGSMTTFASLCVCVCVCTNTQRGALHIATT